MSSRKYFPHRRYQRRRGTGALGSEVITSIGVVLILLIVFTQYFGFGFQGALIILFGALAFILVILLFVSISILKRRKKREQALKFSEVENMTGIQFENYLVGLLRFKGYSEILVTPPKGDYGADLVATYEKQKIAIQAKQYNTWKPVGVDAIYQVLGGEKKYHCDRTMVITTGLFTPQAHELSLHSGTELVDRNLLADWIAEYQSR